MINLQFPLKSQDVPKLFRTLLLFELFLVAVYMGDFLLGEPIWRIHHWFDLDSEVSIPTWFSTLQLFMIGLVALMVAYNEKTTPPPSKKGITIFGLGFIYLSMDEASSIHEKLTHEFYNNPLVPYFHGTHGIWIVVYGIIGLIVLAILSKDIIAVFKHYKKEAFIFAFGMLIYLAGTAGSETITFFYVDKTNPLTYAIEVSLEEFLEMLGASILFCSVILLAIQKLTITDQSV